VRKLKNCVKRPLGSKFVSFSKIKFPSRELQHICQARHAVECTTMEKGVEENEGIWKISLLSIVTEELEVSALLFLNQFLYRETGANLRHQTPNAVVGQENNEERNSNRR